MATISNHAGTGRESAWLEIRVWRGFPTTVGRSGVRGVRDPPYGRI